MRVIAGVSLGLLGCAVLASCHGYFAPRHHDAGDGDLDASDGDADSDVDQGSDGDADSDSDADADPDVDADRDLDADEDVDPDPEIEPECSEDGDCDDGVDCTRDVCSSGLCSNDPRDELCRAAEGEACVSDVGCARVIYVDQACEPGACGDGTAAAPFGTIGDALNHLLAAVARQVIFVAPGTYEEVGREYTAGGTSLAIIGEEGVVWRGTYGTGLRVGNGASLLLAGVTMTGWSVAIECSDGSECELERVALEDCESDGLVARDGARAVLDRCLVRGNARAGLEVRHDSTLVVVNCLIVQNGGPSADAGGVRARDPESRVEAFSTTIADNSGGGNPGAIAAEPASALLLRNLILWSNGGATPEDDCPTCALGPDSLGGGTDPLFSGADGARAAAADYQIQAGSPAIDAGLEATDEGVIVPDVDYFGDPRDDGAIDIGADERRSP